ncbi:bifunctional RNase H/acid phosphatase [Nocardia farcinica]|uniref:Bifunctional RNase H/acid phosphatase n=3 Tax=Nocardia farcinica TaxID=37329 RepID=A0A449G8B9_NOCFR|nr:bifunctional RNase H/acid phosphatase [Nocardia farcinica]MBF6385844.1 bifunctional RNase H/acid phosphatase [Nocardia farcinica]MBF6420777.1 bifunctional RNase H/acid phosphatase [Nocardia farcinica]MBF6432021.1 bifunctional RNase H/acid phosphatase [Nocardia farcinica]MBF6502731.1 bifunctional RNase H/acid phosphatase [Nocardia farcinica]MCZ9329008.1 bifunctional RNase H/acid phosphatase [Nocardia farcinica]
MSYPKVIVEADGGSRGNPGPAGYGAVVFDADHVAVLAERRESVGIATNNVAEYRGLIAGLEAAAELGARTVDVRMDSKLVVEQMSGRWKVKHAAMIPLADRARRLVAGFDAVTFTWIPRAQNAHADRLANEAMDDAAVVEEVRTARDAGHAPTDLGAHRGAARPGPAATGEGAAALPDSGTPDTRVLPDTPADPAPGWTGATGRPTRLLLLRHGQTELSVQRRYSGRGNPPLTELGREQAARAAKMLAAKGGIAAVITSPLGRARQTAEAAAAALGVDVQTDDGLIETDFGEWEGLTFREAAERDPELHAAWLGDPSVPAPGGESFDQVRARVEAARRDLVALYPGRNLVVVSHVTPIKTLLQLALGVGPSLLYRLHLDLASLSIAEFYPDGGSSVRLVNDTSYLA